MNLYYSDCLYYKMIDLVEVALCFFHHLLFFGGFWSKCFIVRVERSPVVDMNETLQEAKIFFHL